MRTGAVNTNLVELNNEFNLPFVRDLVARKLSGEQTELEDADVEFHRREYEKLRLLLLAAHRESALPELPADASRNALNDLLVRIRKKSFSHVEF